MPGLISGTLSAEEAMALALAIEPRVTSVANPEMGEALGGETTLASGLADLVKAYYDALGAEADPVAAAAAVRLGFFPPDDPVALARLVFDLTAGRLADSVGVVEAGARLARALGDGEGIEDAAWGVLAAAAAFLPFDKIGQGAIRLLKGGTRLGIETLRELTLAARAGLEEAIALGGTAEKELKKAAGEAGALDQRATNSDKTEPLAGKGETPDGAPRSPSHAEAAQLARDAEKYLVTMYGRGGSLSNPEYLDGFIKQLQVPPQKAELLRDIFSRDIIPRAAEREVGDALTNFAEGTGFRVWGGKKSVRGERPDANAFPDIALRPADMSDKDFGVFVKDAIANIDKRSFAIFEVKTGTAELSLRQGELLEMLLRAGKADIFVLYNLPQSKIRSAFLADSVEKFLRANQVLSNEERNIVERLSEEMQKTLSPDLSAGEIFFYTLLATCTVLGLHYEWDRE